VRVVRYLKGTRDLALRLGGTSAIPTPLGYSDSDYANDPGHHGRRSVGGYCFSFGSAVISWSSKKQKVIADSTCAAEYIAVSEAGKELVWIRQLLTELGYKPKDASRLLCDNTAAVLLSADQAFHNRTKHLDVRYHWIRERVENGEIVVTRVASSDNIADGFTKALPMPAFVDFRNFLGLVKSNV
jgi:hypothetical protein